MEGDRRALPDFFPGSYDAAVRKAKLEAKVMAVVITCEEHESHEEFARLVCCG